MLPLFSFEGEQLTDFTSRIKQSQYIRVLSHRGFRNIWLAGLISKSGDVFYRIAIIWFVSQEMESAVAVGAVVISASLPILLFRLVGGVASDWFDRRRIMIYANLLQALLVVLLPILFYLGTLSLLLILILTFLREVLNQFFQPARQALIPSLLPKESLPIANSLDSTSSFGVSAAIPVTVGVLIAMIGPISAFFIDAASFMLSAGLLFFLRLSFPDKEANTPPRLTLRSLWSSLTDGVTYLFRNPILRAVAVINMVSIFAFGPYGPVSLLYFQDSVGMDSLQYGLTLSFGLVGLTVGTTVAGPWAKVLQPGRMYALGFGLMGIMTIAIGIVPLVLPVLILNTVRSFANGLIVVSYTTLLQTQTESTHLGRVFSNMMLISEGLRSVSVAVGTSLAEFTSAQLTIIVSSTFFIAASLIAISNTGLQIVAKKTPESSPNN